MTEEVGQKVDRIANIGSAVAVDITRGDAIDVKLVEQILKDRNRIGDVEGSIAVFVAHMVPVLSWC